MRPTSVKLPSGSRLRSAVAAPIRRAAKTVLRRAVVALVDRSDKASGVRVFQVAKADREMVANIVRESIARETTPMTSESRLYMKVRKEFAGH
jgi:hypothetical protein